VTRSTSAAWDDTGRDTTSFGPPPAPAWTLEACMLELLELFSSAPAR
jgi:hypothetical protein